VKSRNSSQRNETFLVMLFHDQLHTCWWKCYCWCALCMYIFGRLFKNV